MFGFHRVAAAVPKLKVADVEFNVAEIIGLVQKASAENASVIVFPELCITGYTCGDLFAQEKLIKEALDSLTQIAETTSKNGISAIIGLPLKYRNSVYNCAAVLDNGNITGIVPKSFLPNYREFYEKRWFKSGRNIRNAQILIAGKKIPFGTDLIFEKGSELRFAIEICEDLWYPIPPSSFSSLAGANLIANLSASNELVAKSTYRKNLVKDQSARCIAGYVYANSGVYESTTDLVFSGHSIIAENGAVLCETRRFSRNSELLLADIDFQKLDALRASESSFSDNTDICEFRNIELSPNPKIHEISRTFSKHPFVPDNKYEIEERCREIFSIQCAGLAKRIEHCKARKAVIGISGGLDSTLALLVATESLKLLQRPAQDIIAITMPGFGTGDRTYQNALSLCKILEVSFREINIRNACLQHFKDIEHPQEKHDITFENAQARERTQILMDIANSEGGIVVGTGDLSEIALGWSTYSGDHISMYAVNCGVPKTLVRFIISWIAENSAPTLKAILEDISATPVSPELLPESKSGEISQKTEEIIGPYELHDFFLYHFARYGASPEKILYLANKTFQNDYSAEQIKNWLIVFLKRFFSQQFKRSCMPDGPKVGMIALSPRGDWRMPSDAEAKLWLKNIVS